MASFPFLLGLLFGPLRLARSVQGNPSASDLHRSFGPGSSALVAWARTDSHEIKAVRPESLLPHGFADASGGRVHLWWRLCARRTRDMTPTFGSVGGGRDLEGTWMGVFLGPSHTHACACRMEGTMLVRPRLHGRQSEPGKWFLKRRRDISAVLTRVSTKVIHIPCHDETTHDASEICMVSLTSLALEWTRWWGGYTLRRFRFKRMAILSRLGL